MRSLTAAHRGSDTFVPLPSLRRAALAHNGPLKGCWPNCSRDMLDFFVKILLWLQHIKLTVNCRLNCRADPRSLPPKAGFFTH